MTEERSVAEEKKIEQFPNDQVTGRRKRQQASFAGPAVSFLILFLMFLLMLPTTVFLFLAMLPTLVSMFADNRQEGGHKYKYKWLCIGGLNVAGALPFLFQMWFGDNSLDAAIGMFMQVSTVVVVYGAAGVGWVFYRCIPLLVLHFLELSDQRKVITLKERQKKLIEKWGHEITVSSSESKR